MTLRSKVNAPAPHGVTVLRAHIERHHGTAEAFCRRHRSVKYSQLRKLISGEMARIDVDLAWEVARAVRFDDPCSASPMSTDDFVMARPQRKARAAAIRKLRAGRAS